MAARGMAMVAAMLNLETPFFKWGASLKSSRKLAPRSLMCGSRILGGWRRCGRRRWLRVQIDVVVGRGASVLSVNVLLGFADAAVLIDQTVGISGQRSRLRRCYIGRRGFRGRRV